MSYLASRPHRGLPDGPDLRQGDAPPQAARARFWTLFLLSCNLSACRCGVTAGPTCRCRSFARWCLWVAARVPLSPCWRSSSGCRCLRHRGSWGLVGKNFVTRRIPEGNRRLVALALSANGRRTIRVAWQAAEDRLAHIMASLPVRERAAIQHALRILCEKVQSLPAETDSSQLPQSSPNLRRRR